VLSFKIEFSNLHGDFNALKERGVDFIKAQRNTAPGEKNFLRKKNIP
jgi:hypothetical protein